MKWDKTLQVSLQRLRASKNVGFRTRGEVVMRERVEWILPLVSTLITFSQYFHLLYFVANMFQAIKLIIKRICRKDSIYRWYK